MLHKLCVGEYRFNIVRCIHILYLLNYESLTYFDVEYLVTFLTFRGSCIVIYSYNETDEMH